MKTFEKILTVLFWLAVLTFALFATLGIWNVVSVEVAWKSLATLMMFLIVAFVSMLTIRIVRK